MSGGARYLRACMVMASGNGCICVGEGLRVAQTLRGARGTRVPRSLFSFYPHQFEGPTIWDEARAMPA